MGGGRAPARRDRLPDALRDALPRAARPRAREAARPEPDRGGAGGRGAGGVPAAPRVGRRLAQLWHRGRQAGGPAAGGARPRPRDPEEPRSARGGRAGSRQPGAGHARPPRACPRGAARALRGGARPGARGAAGGALPPRPGRAPAARGAEPARRLEATARLKKRRGRPKPAPPISAFAGRSAYLGAFLWQLSHFARALFSCFLWQSWHTAWPFFMSSVILAGSPAPWQTSHFTALCVSCLKVMSPCLADFRTMASFGGSAARTGAAKRLTASATESIRIMGLPLVNGARSGRRRAVADNTAQLPGHSKTNPRCDSVPHVRRCGGVPVEKWTVISLDLQWRDHARTGRRPRLDPLRPGQGAGSLRAQGRTGAGARRHREAALRARPCAGDAAGGEARSRPPPLP